jgi:hypothetical protein
LAEVCSKCGGERSGVHRQRDHFEALVGGGRIILKWIFKKTVRGRVLIHLAREMGRLRAVSNAVMNPRVPYNAIKFLTT